MSLFLFAVRFFFLPRGYSFCGESFSFRCEVFLSAVRLFFLPKSFSFCCEVTVSNSFAMTVVGHCTKARQTTSNWTVRILYEAT